MGLVLDVKIGKTLEIVDGFAEIWMKSELLRDAFKTLTKLGVEVVGASIVGQSHHTCQRLESVYLYQILCRRPYRPCSGDQLEL